MVALHGRLLALVVALTATAGLFVLVLGSVVQAGSLGASGTIGVALGVLLVLLFALLLWTVGRRRPAK